MKYMVGCVVSAVLGSLLTVWMIDVRATGGLEAQERPRSGPFLNPPGSGTGTLSGPTGPVFGGPAGAGTTPGGVGNGAAGGPNSSPVPNSGRVPFRPGSGVTAPQAMQPGLGFVDQLTPEEQVNVAVYENINKSVVNVITKAVRSDGFFLLEYSSEGSGSGSVIDKAGHILTNFHVVEDARQVSVTIHDGKSYDAKFVGADPINDVAVIKIDAPAESLYPVTFGDSRRLKVGQRVYAIGNPFGLERTLTTGIISSLNRSLQIHQNRTIKSIIQIDAAINPGNSGGPLVDTQSRLIGMNTAIASKTGQSSGVGFAIPINLIARIVPQLIDKGHVVRPDVGIAKVYETEKGLLIAKLIPGGPAERAGLRGPAVTTKRRGPFTVESVDRSAADLIVAVDGEKVASGDDFLSLIERHDPGKTVVLTVVRQGREVNVSVLLGGGEVQSPGGRNTL